MNTQLWSILLFSVVLIIGVIFYGIYMIMAIKKDLVKKITPDERTFRLVFFVLIMVVIFYLGLTFGKEIIKELLILLGTIAGYVLGGGKLPTKKQSESEN